tara:strand:- start:409 stop:603 length:195 start_codon:yes stop_codon:yes gene_type:complete
MLSDIRVFYDGGWWKLEYKKAAGTTISYLMQGNKKHTQKAAFKKAEDKLDKEWPKWRGEEKKDE